MCSAVDSPGTCSSDFDFILDWMLVIVIGHIRCFMCKEVTIQILGGGSGIFELDKLFISTPFLQYSTYFTLSQAKYVFHLSAI